MVSKTKVTLLFSRIINLNIQLHKIYVGRISSLIADNGTILFDKTRASESDSGDGSGGTIIPEYTASALLQVIVEDGRGIQCSDVGQYECIAGISNQPGDIVNVTVSLVKKGKLKDNASKSLNNHSCRDTCLRCSNNNHCADIIV